jgi:hypothetical protein
VKDVLDAVPIETPFFNTE